jgi:hypothetical protein
MRDIQQVNLSSQDHRYAEGTAKKAKTNLLPATDEVDIFELLLYAIETVTRYKKLVIGALVFAVVTAIILLQTITPRYEKIMVCSIGFVDATALSQILLEIKSQIDDDRFKGLNSLEVKDPSNVKNNTYEIVATFAQGADVSKLQQEIIHHINNNHYVNNRASVEKDKMAKMISMLKTDEQKIDDVLADPGNKGNESVSIADLSKLKMDYYKERINLEGQLSAFSAVTIIQNFTGGKIPVNKSALKISAFCLLGVLFITFGIIIFLEIRRKVQEHQRKILQLKKNAVNLSIGINS